MHDTVTAIGQSYLTHSRVLLSVLDLLILLQLMKLWHLIFIIVARGKKWEMEKSEVGGFFFFYLIVEKYVVILLF